MCPSQQPHSTHREINNNLYKSTDLLVLQWNFNVVLFAFRQKVSIIYFYFQLNNRDCVPRKISVWKKGSTDKILKILTYIRCCQTVPFALGYPSFTRGFNSSCCSVWRDCEFLTILLLSRSYAAPRPRECKELTVPTVHRARHWMGKGNSYAGCSARITSNVVATCSLSKYGQIASRYKTVRPFWAFYTYSLMTI